MKKKFWVGLAGLSLLVVVLVISRAQSTDIAEACGGFFCTNTPIDQSGERIIFTVNDDDTITAIVGINYVGEAEDFSWVVPVSSPPVLDVAETRTIDALQQGTSVSFGLPDNYCPDLLPLTRAIGGGDEGGYLEEGGIGPYDYAIIGSEDANELVTWLRDNGYQVTEAMEPVIAEYVDAGMYFLAMRLQQDATTDDIQPIVMTYEGQNPMIPIKLTAVAAVDNMPIYVWIFGDTQYIPANYAHPSVDFSTYRGPRQIVEPFPALTNFFNGWATGAANRDNNLSYIDSITAIQTEYAGLAFVTEYAGLTAETRFQISAPDELLAELMTQNNYVTRLRARMSPEQMTLDPYFVPDAEADPVSSFIRLENHVDPLDYWGCSTSSLEAEIDPELVERTHISAINFDARHPEGWMLTELEIDTLVPEVHDVDTIPVWIIAPREVTVADIDAYFNGESTIPMLIVVDSKSAFESLGKVFYSDNVNISAIPNIFGYEDFPYSQSETRTIRLRRDLYGFEESIWLRHGIFYGIFTSDDDWAENEALYTAMLDYGGAYQYLNHPELKHTLLLNRPLNITLEDESVQRIPTAVDLPYPENWQAYWSEDNHVVIQPKSRLEDEVAPQLKLITLRDNDTLYLTLNELFEGVAQQYELSSENVTQIVQEIENRPRQLSWTTECTFVSSFVEFSLNGRQGYIIITDSYVVEASAETAEFAEYDELFQLMLNNICQAYS